jgi:hypothetical protein
VVQRKETSVIHNLDRESWQFVLQAIHRAARNHKPSGRRPKYANGLIVAMYCWSVWHDRCLSWACQRGHYNSIFRPRGTLPSISQFTRRIKTDDCQDILQMVHEDLAARGVPNLLDYIDGKPLLVGASSKDPDAGRGHISGGFGKGYKLHACVGQNRRISVWCVSPLNTDERTVARELLLPHLPTPLDPRSSLTLADSNYDAARLYNAFADQGHALLASVRSQKLVGPNGRHPRTLKQMGPVRREALKLWEQHPHLTRFMIEERKNIEGAFSVLAVALGLYSLPSFVRRMPRVRRWVGTKIILYHARLSAQERMEQKLAA